MKIFICLFLLIFLFSCSEKKTECHLNINEILKEKGRIYSITNEKDKFEKKFKDLAKDSIEGGEYTFYKNENLKSYRYFSDSATCIYSLDYDSSGYLIEENGSPLIHRYASLINDSVIIKFYFLILNKSYKRIDLSIDNAIIPLSLHSDTIYTNVKVAKYVLHNLKSERDIKGIITVEYDNECTFPVLKTFKDSIELHYTPFN